MKGIQYCKGNVFLEEKIKQNLRKIILEQFNISGDKLEEVENLYLLGLMPRDVVRLILQIENEYDIHFTEAELAENRFDSIADITLAVSKHIHK